MNDQMKSEEARRGRVRIEKGRFKLDGKFHFISPNSPIRDDKGNLAGVTNPRDMTYVHMYGGEAVFFEALSAGKIMATRCDNGGCPAHGSVFMPFRIHCPDCLVRCTVVDITDIAKTTGTVHTFMITERTGAFNTLPKPIKFVNVEFAGVCTILMGPLAVGEPAIGMRAVPIFNTTAPTYTILDLRWVPEGTPASELPEGFTFG